MVHKWFWPCVYRGFEIHILCTPDDKCCQDSHSFEMQFFHSKSLVPCRFSSDTPRAPETEPHLLSMISRRIISSGGGGEKDPLWSGRQQPVMCKVFCDYDAVEQPHLADPFPLRPMITSKTRKRVTYHIHEGFPPIPWKVQGLGYFH